MNKADEDEYHCDDEEDMYERSDGIGTNDSKEPEDNENDCDSVEHGYTGTMWKTRRSMRCKSSRIDIFIWVIRVLFRSYICSRWSMEGLTTVPERYISPNLELRPEAWYT